MTNPYEGMKDSPICVDTQVASALADLRSAIDSAQQLQANFGARLRSVLRDEDANSKALAEPCPAYVPLASDIRDMADEVGRLNVRYEDMLRRLEL